MTKSLSSFLQELIDYAGLFPPASLELGPALSSYREYLLGPFAPILGRFICPADQLEKAAGIWSDFDTGHELPVSILCGEASSPRLLELLTRIGELGRETPLQVEMLELRLVGAEPDNQLRKLLPGLCDGLSQSGLESARVFVEAPGQKDPFSFCSELASTGLNGPGLGLKLRCGGIEHGAFPSLEHVERTLRACLSYQVPFKATAGLHHPIRYFNSSIEVMSHGFINIFAGGMVATADDGLLPKCLAERDASRFHFDDEGLRYESTFISRSQIEHLRNSLFVSFGSCSFSEPLDDLHELGWISGRIAAQTLPD